MGREYSHLCLSFIYQEISLEKRQETQSHNVCCCRQAGGAFKDLNAGSAIFHVGPSQVSFLLMESLAFMRAETGYHSFQAAAPQLVAHPLTQFYREFTSSAAVLLCTWEKTGLCPFSRPCFGCCYCVITDRRTQIVPQVNGGMSGPPA